MSRFSVNNLCPCESGLKYKKCCGLYHKGLQPKNALLLMKSRYSAFATANSKYLIKTTHPNNPDYTTDIKKWRASLDLYCREVDFLSLEIIDFTDGENEAFVTFRAKLSTGDLVEKSRFLKVNNMWLYVDGEF